MTSKRAFTLIELLVVISIIVILSGFAIARLSGAINSANDAKKEANLNSIKKALIAYGIEHEETYPIASCTIGSCTTLDSAMTGFLPKTLEGTYTYASTDGESFTLSSVLSSGYAYTYDSTTNSFTTAAPTNGSCGTANKTYAYNATTYGSDTFCTVGSSTPTTPEFPTLGSSTSWSCSGTNGGSSASCSASRSGTPVNGACGTSNGQNLTEQPATNLCTTGTATTVSGSGPWLWSCTGSNGGTDDSCATGGIPVNGSCGSANKTYAYSATTYGSDTFCTTGTANPVTPQFPGLGSSTTWSCDGANTGTNQSCTASRNNTPINGACGTKNGKYASSTPTGTEACATGTLSNMTGSYSWTCSGQYLGTNATCATVAATYGVTSFTTVGTTTWTVPTGVTSVDYLVVGGGGSGGRYPGGGGGAGAFKTGNGLAVSGTETIVVGAGGAAVSSNIQGNKGSISSLTNDGTTIVAEGGGYGGGNSGGGGVGGSSGGASDNTVGSIVNPTDSNYGNAGGGSTGAQSSGGGGGKGSAGASGATSVGGNGGTGIASSITGASVMYAAGGGGSGNTVGGAGGSGIGGQGGINGGSDVTAGTANTGSGGGGVYNTSSSGAGGSGIVIVKYINNY